MMTSWHLQLARLMGNAAYTCVQHLARCVDAAKLYYKKIECNVIAVCRNSSLLAESSGGPDLVVLELPQLVVSVFCAR